MKLLPLVFISSCSLLTACGGSSGGSDSDNDDDNSTPVNTALFVDSGVAGLNYSSPSHQGITNTLGAFSYEPGETTTFSFAGLTLGSITIAEGTGTLTPLDLFNTSDVNDQRVKNTLVLLQNLDSDGNAQNGITLQPFPEGSGADISALDLAADSADFSSALLSAAFPYESERELISEEDALAHFEQSLSAINAGLQLTGTWLERNDNGEIRYKYTYESNGNMTAVSYSNCTDDDFYRAPTEASVNRNCRVSSASYTYEFSERVLTIYSNGEFADRCTVLRSSEYAYDATCTTDEFIHLERVITELSNNLIADSYRLVTVGSSSFSELTFDKESGTGSYQSYTDGIAGSGNTDSGTFTWSASGNTLTYSGTHEDGIATFTDTLTLKNNNAGIRGALVTTSAAEEGTTQLLIPYFDSSLAANFFSQSLYGIYDAVSGVCLAVYDGGTKLDNAGNNDICKYDPADFGNTTASINFTERHGSLVLSEGGEDDICWPVSRIITSENGSYTLMACSPDNGGPDSFNYQLWYTL
ncbi:hypothetical protein [Thalassolituus sp. C2-1]|uniref:hypothetical protein n=1 Tax=Venatorbacter sp. C2-1 TaxID=2597518 RepID=UPI0011924FD1|nr:hypothetical protein [Thalassolituus sp. C2-1]TVV44549.1 hypothetical protein FOT50_05130 [Thalassolituus sp. C2-1]